MAQGLTEGIINEFVFSDEEWEVPPSPPAPPFVHWGRTPNISAPFRFTCLCSLQTCLGLNLVKSIHEAARNACRVSSVRGVRCASCKLYFFFCFFFITLKP